MATGEGKQTTSTYPRTAAALALVGGMCVIVGGAIFLGAATFILPHLYYSTLTVPQGFNRADLPVLISGIVSVMGGFGLVCGSIVLLSATMILAKVGQRRTWGVLILVFSVLSFVGLGGFIIGALLGIVGGILILRWKPLPPQGQM